MVSLKEYLDSKCNERMRQYCVAVLNLERRLDSLRKQYEDKHNVLERTIGEKFLWLERSTQTVASVMEKRLDGMNEFRDALKDQMSRMATRTELESLKSGMTALFSRQEHEAFQKVVESDLRVLRESRAELKGMASQASMNITFVLAAAGMILSVANILIDMLTKK